MRNNRVRLVIASLMATIPLAIGVSGCAEHHPPGGDERGTSVEEVTEAAADVSDGSDEVAPPPSPATEGEGDDVLGLERDSMVEVVDSTYQSRNAEARWEQDTFVVTMDGDAKEDMAGFSDCRVLTQLLNEGDEVRMEYPNGTVDCAVALQED